MTIFTINIHKTYEVTQTAQVELEFDNLDEAEDWITTDAFYVYVDDLLFVDEEWYQMDIETEILNQPK